MKNNKKELELEAEKYSEATSKECIESNAYCDEGSLMLGFITGATSKYVEKQKLQFAIEQLNKLDTELQSKIEKLYKLFDGFKDSDNKEYFRIKISGVRLSKIEIRRDIKQLEQKLSEL